MVTQPEWIDIPAAASAADAGDFASILRIARTAAGLTLHQAGELTGYSASTISRMETRPRRTWDVKDLRRLAEVYGIPLQLFGLSTSIPTSVRASLSVYPDDGGDAMQRRVLLAGTTAVATSAALPPLDRASAANSMADTVEDVLFGRLTAEPIPGNQLVAQIAAARADLRATRYAQLARRLPRLLALATAGCDSTPVGQRAIASGRLAHAYCIAAQLLVKLHDDGMACAIVDRAVQAARASDDAMILAEATRLVATVLRRTRRRDGAQRLLIGAAQQLDADTGLTDAAHTAMYGQLLAAASYTAAMSDDRDTAWTLLTEAADAARRTGADQGERFNLLDLSVYKISIARVLGDYGAAVEYARLVDPSRITAPERRARYWEDTALALHGRGRSTAAFQALLSAERDTPQEVRYRPWAHELTRDLISRESRNALPGLREFAQRVGATV